MGETGNRGVGINWTNTGRGRARVPQVPTILSSFTHPSLLPKSERGQPQPSFTSDHHLPSPLPPLLASPHVFYVARHDDSDPATAWPSWRRAAAFVRDGRQLDLVLAVPDKARRQRLCRHGRGTHSSSLLSPACALGGMGGVKWWCGRERWRWVARQLVPISLPARRSASPTIKTSRGSALYNPNLRLRHCS